MNTSRPLIPIPEYVLPLRTGECGFPECEHPAVTAAGMCEQHRRVAMSTTGSWLEAG